MTCSPTATRAVRELPAPISEGASRATSHSPYCVQRDWCSVDKACSLGGQSRTVQDTVDGIPEPSVQVPLIVFTV